MQQYLKQFTNHSQYESYIATDYAKPNVSYCEDQNEVHYNPWVDTRLIAKFNVTSTSSPTKITGYNTYTLIVTTDYFSEIEIDGVVQPSVVRSYTFETTGEHTVKYTLVDPTTIDDSAFYDCKELVEITIPNSVTSISNGAFYGCSGLTSITIPSGVTTIGRGSFQACSGLTSVTIPNSVTSIDNSAFMNCSSLASVTIGSGVTSIGERTFKNCSSLTSIIIPDNITSIMSYAFEDCSGLTSITTLAATPPTLNTSPFYNTNNCPIYVPAASVEAYKAAWTNYTSRIQAIPTT